MKYFIAVEVEATGPIEDLKASLQRAYDRGAAGFFKILVTHAPTYMILFERNAVDDGEYVSKRANNGKLSIENASMQQLAAELVDGGIGSTAQPVVDVLVNGDAHCFDFGIALIAMAALKPETASTNDFTITGCTPLVHDCYAESIIGSNSSKYDGTEVHGVRKVNENDPLLECLEVDDENPEMYSVYVHLVEGGVECVGDFGSKAAADAYSEELDKIYGWGIHARIINELHA